MTQDEIIRFAIQCHLVTTGNRDGLYMDSLIEFAHLVAAKVTQQEQDRCCSIVFGQCESDNVAQRTVNAIRGKA